MSEILQNRNYSQPIIWEGDLNDDCTAIWSGLMLRAEWMDENYWWWCVYDNLNNDIQLDSSNEYQERFIDAETTRKKAESVAKEYLKNELISKLEKSKEEINMDILISDLKKLSSNPFDSIKILMNNFDYKYSDAKNKIFDSEVWEGLREISEKMTQDFLDVIAEDKEAEEVKYIDGKVASVTFDLTKEKITLWEKIKSKFKK